MKKNSKIGKMCPTPCMRGKIFLVSFVSYISSSLLLIQFPVLFLNSNWMWILSVCLLTQFSDPDFGQIQSYLDSLVTSHKSLFGFHFDPILSRKDLPIDFKGLWCIWYLKIRNQLKSILLSEYNWLHFGACLVYFCVLCFVKCIFFQVSVYLCWNLC